MDFIKKNDGTRACEVLNAIINFPFQTSYEYAIMLRYDDPNKVRPRITELKQGGVIIAISKRKCAVSNVTSTTWSTICGLEYMIMKQIGFIETKPHLWVFETKDGVKIYFDYRKTGKRMTYCFPAVENYLDLEIHKTFLKILGSYFTR